MEKIKIAVIAGLPLREKLNWAFKLPSRLTEK